MPNRLTGESSPYLQQHAENPVDWFPWSEEAFARAREDDKAVLLSIGYSACHWCHVMERESFEDPETAAIMNELFVSIKVDREERPDIDQIYIKAVQAMTGSAGWPLTVWITPDGVPFYGGTYYPPEPRHGMPSFRQIMQGVADAYRDRRPQVLEAGGRLVEALERTSDVSTPGDADVELVEQAYQTLATRYDPHHGGFGSAPKFPQPATLELVLRHAARSGDERAGSQLAHTLRRMAAGGMRDQLGGAFHRYSVDAQWLVPHFEKMLYDNALLARLYVDAFRFDGDVRFRTVAQEVLDDVLADMRSPDGGFYSARDADSEGEEGTFYVWTPAEITSVLGEQRADAFMRVYGVREGGNFEGKSILHVAEEPEAVAADEGVDTEVLVTRLREDRARLMAVRAEREAPFRDQKVLVAWNAMTIRALAEVGATLGRWDYVDAAATAARFIQDRMRVDGRLRRVFMDGEAKVSAFLEDHAALGNALLSLHAATLDPRWLEIARWCCDEILSRFRDEASGRLFDAPADGEALVVRPRDATDGATPSGTSLAAELLVRAGHLFDDTSYREAADRIFELEAGAMRQFGSAFGRMLSAVDRARAAPVEIAIVGPPDAPETRALIQAAHAHFLPNVTVLGRAPKTSTDLPLLKGREMVDGRPAAYVCRAYACYLPVTDAAGVHEELERVLRS